MYQIKCDNYILYDPRDDELIITSPKCKLEVNTVGEASFTMYASHPYYSKLRKLRSVFEILQDGERIFRGRMTEDSKDFDNIKIVDLEGAMSYFNDSIIRPFVFPDDFASDSAYTTATNSGNVIEYFLSWLIEQHNSQVQEFQQFKLGNVTVADSSNYIYRESSDYLKTWEVLKSKLFDSGLGGYLCIRYEDDGNYIDYLVDFDLTNPQPIEFGENLLDIETISDASTTYSAVIPLGAKMKEISEESEDESRLTIEELEDGEITDDIIKKGDTIYSKSAVGKYGWIYAPTKETTWDDVMVVSSLQKNGVEFLSNTATTLTNTVEITAVDLHASDAEIEAFRIYRYVLVNSKPHDHEGQYRLTKLDIDILNPQNTKITLGDTTRSMTDINRGTKQTLENAVSSITSKTTSQSADLTVIHNTLKTIEEGNRQKVLWSGANLMSGSDSISLSDLVSNQTRGILLVFSKYTSGAAQDSDFSHFFIPKSFVAQHPGKYSNFFMIAADFSAIGLKKLYISNESITGDDMNESTGSNSSVTYANNAFVLRYVIGI